MQPYVYYLHKLILMFQENKGNVRLTCNVHRDECIITDWKNCFIAHKILPGSIFTVTRDYTYWYMYVLPINTQVDVSVAIIVYCYESSIHVFLHLLSDAWYLVIIILSVVTILHITLVQIFEKIWCKMIKHSFLNLNA